MSTAPAPPLPGHACQVFDADAIFVSHGVNLGDGLAPPDEVCAGDIYQLDREAVAMRLMLARADGPPCVAAGGQIGTPGQALHLEARHTLMAPDGDKVDLLVLALEESARFVLPLSPIGSRIDYTLVQTEAGPADVRLTDLLCISFARGTMITLSGGRQCAIEDLAPGDRVLTRDHGPQPVRWLGRATLRAVGAFAPVVITKGALGNAGDLIVSQHHRMFLYLREAKAGLATAELLVQAKHLVDGERVLLRPGGVVDWFSIVFDRHEIIYAEGIPAESLMVNEATLQRLPPDLAEEVRAAFPGLTQNQHFGTEAGREMVDDLGRATLYRKQ